VDREGLGELPLVGHIREDRGLFERVSEQRIQFAGTEAINGFADTGDKFTQLGRVVVRDHRTRRPSLRLTGPESEVTHGLVPGGGGWRAYRTGPPPEDPRAHTINLEKDRALATRQETVVLDKDDRKQPGRARQQHTEASRYEEGISTAL
jgi:hypothetical protein